MSALHKAGDPALGQGKPVLTFDTSAVNWLGDDLERGALGAGIKTGFWFRLSGDTFGELVGTTDTARRKLLLDLGRELLTMGDCLLPHDELLRQVAKQHSAAGGINWKTIPVRCREFEDEIARQELINGDIAIVQRLFQREVGSEFDGIWKHARPKFQELLRNHDSAVLGLSGVIDALQVPGGAFWSIVAGLYERATGVRLSEADTRSFVDICPPFRALPIALCFAQYQRCIQNPQTKSRGAFDL